MASAKSNKTQIAFFFIIHILGLGLSLSQAQEIQNPGALSSKPQHELVLIKSPEANQAEYEDYLKKNNNVLGYIDYQIKKIQENESQEQKIFELSELAEMNPAVLIESINSLTSKEVLTQTSLNFLNDLSSKMLTRNLSKSEVTYFNNLICKYSVLSRELSPESCKKSKVDMGTLRRQWPQAQILLIESNKYLTEDSGAEINPQSNYHWTLISNSNKAIVFYGTYEQFISQRFNFESLAVGTCASHSSNIPDLELSSRSLVFYNKNCLASSFIEPIEKFNTANWFSKNKSWLYPVGAILIGGAALQLQNKVLVINNPF
jgi:hypothetical protein